MSVLSQFLSGGGGGGSYGRKQNRQIFVGPLSTTWAVNSNVTEVEVHCWGGGGNGGTGLYTLSTPSETYRFGSGGGGGGYVVRTYSVSQGDVLSITVGGTGGTSSVSCPSKTPSFPISATGGSPGTTSPVVSGQIAAGGSGGSGSGSSYNYRGGNGGPSNATIVVAAPSGYPSSQGGGAGGGGSGASYMGNGGNGGTGVWDTSGSFYLGASGGGIAGPGNTDNPINPVVVGGPAYNIPSLMNVYTNYTQYANNSTTVGLTTWFYANEIVGFTTETSINGDGTGQPTSSPFTNNTRFLGGSRSSTSRITPANNANLVGGAGGGGCAGRYDPGIPNPGGSGGVGVVILYW